MADSDAPWYQTFFSGTYLEIFSHHLTPDRAEKEVDFVESTLNLDTGAKVLDLCCGNGRHAILLAKRGLQVTAQDLNREYLESAQDLAVAEGVELETVHSDMREIPFEGNFDAVINMFTAFGYLESEEEDAKVLQQAAKALKPGGQLLLDLLNREWVVLNYIQNEWRKATDGTIYLEHRELDLETSRNRVTVTIISPAGETQQITSFEIRLYTLTEIIAMLDRAGLAFAGAYGGFDGEPYSITTRRMVVVARNSV